MYLLFQRLSDATVKGGNDMDQTFNKVASDIDAAFAKIDAAVGLHRSQIKKLEEEYKQIGLAQDTSIDANKGGYQTDRQQAIAGEMRVRRQLIKEAEDAADELRKHEVILENVRKKTEESAKAYQTLQSRIRELKEEMARLVSQGIDQQSEAYKSLANELGQLKKSSDGYCSTRENSIERSSRFSRGSTGSFGTCWRAFCSNRGCVIVCRRK